MRLAARLAGEHGLTERSNTFDRRAVLQEFAAAAAQGARVAAVRDRADWFVDRGEVLRTRNDEMTTQDLVGCERRLIDSALGRIDAGCAIVSEGEIARAVASADRRLTDEQAEVVRLTASSGHGVQVVEALAGTGKTYTAGVLRSLYERAGYRVVGLAPTGRGARELTEDAGISACTIDRALLDIEQLGAGLPEGCVDRARRGRDGADSSDRAIVGARGARGGEGDRYRGLGSASLRARWRLAASCWRASRGAAAD